MEQGFQTIMVSKPRISFEDRGERFWHCLRKAIRSHKKARLEFARSHKDWRAEQWSQVIFSDESRFLLHRNDGRVYVRRMAGEEFMEDCVQPTMKHGGGGIIVWGCINAKGVGFLTKVEAEWGRLHQYSRKCTYLNHSPADNHQWLDISAGLRHMSNLKASLGIV